MNKGWYAGLSSRFSNHYYVKLRTDKIQSRCGQISLKMLGGRGLEALKPMNTKTKNNNMCRGCQNLLKQDEEQKLLLEPHRY